jgi:osmotically-inducible protein OsmY
MSAAKNSAPQRMGGADCGVAAARGAGTCLAVTKVAEEDMTTTVTGVEQWVRDAVLRQLAWEPGLDATMIGVTAQDGIITLSGYVESYAGKLAAERTARKVLGVKGIANELDVRLTHDRIDPDIARDALEALNARVDVPRGLGVTVRDGHVTLTGEVEWMFQKQVAEKAVKYLRGVRGVSNQITLRPKISPDDVQKRITEALHRHADVDARRVHVEAEGNRVILSGNVRSCHEKDEAGDAAWSAPGVVWVDNRINVVP